MWPSMRHSSMAYVLAKIAYDQELEDKFDGLELNHILRCLNEVANALAKMVSSQELMPTGILASDQYKPLVRYEEPE